MSWPDGGATPFRGEKATNWEGGFRTPCLIRWPGVIKPGTIYSDMFAHAWVGFLQRTAGTTLSDAASRLLNDLEYRSPSAVAAVSADEANLIARAARAWIEKHRV